MGRNRNYVNQGNRLMLQSMTGYYIPPLQEFDIKSEIPQYTKMTVSALRDLIQEKNKFIDIDDNQADTLGWYKEKGKMFKFRDGKSDVYTKGGYDTEIFEYLDRQFSESIKWRIETNATIDFIAGGKIFLNGKEMVILKVLNIITSGTRENKFLAMRNFSHIEEYATKMLALI